MKVIVSGSTPTSDARDFIISLKSLGLRPIIKYFEILERLALLLSETAYSEIDE